MSEIEKTRISQLPLFLGGALPATGMIPMSFGGVTYRAPGSIFPEGGEPSPGGANQIFVGNTVPVDDPGVTPAIYYYMVGDLNSIDPNINLGEFIVYFWNGVAWLPQWGYSWSDSVAWGEITPKVRFQRHMQINEPGSSTGFWSMGFEVAAGLDNQSWVYA